MFMFISAGLFQFEGQQVRGLGLEMNYDYFAVCFDLKPG